MNLGAQLAFGNSYSLLDGATLGGPGHPTRIEGGEVMAVLQVAMLGRLPYTVLRDGVFAHPTLAESFNNIFLALDRADKRGRQE